MDKPFSNYFYSRFSNYYSRFSSCFHSWLSGYSPGFLLIISMLLLINLPYFLHYTIMIADSLSTYMVFSLAYREFFFNHDLLQWLPFSLYGQQPDGYLFGALTPASFFTAVLGYIMNVKDTAFLFHFSIVVEQLVYILGIYLLSRVLFEEKLSVIIVSLSSVLSQVVVQQLAFNFRAYYTLPLCIFFFIKFFNRHDIFYLLVIINIFLLSINGYLALITAIELTIIFFVLFLYNYPGILKQSFIHKKTLLLNIILMISSAILLGAIAYINLHQFDNLSFLLNGRDVGAKTVPLNVFLSYGGFIGIKKLADLFMPFEFMHIYQDVTLYVGLITFCLAAYGMVKSKSPYLSAFIAAVCFLVFLSIGGLSAKLFYYLIPGMKYYRHIGLVAGSLKMYIPLIAGFGVDYIIKHETYRKFDYPIISILLAGTLIYYIESIYFLRDTTVITIYALFVIVVVTIFMVIKSKMDAKLYFKLVLILSVCIELLGYQAVIHTKFHSYFDEYPKGFNLLNDYEYQEERRNSIPENDRKITSVFRNSRRTVYYPIYTYFYDLVRWDICVPMYKNILVNSEVLNLLKARNSLIEQESVFLNPDDRVLQRSLGCNYKKLKLISNVIFSDTYDDSLKLISGKHYPDDAVVLTNVPEYLKNSWKNQPVINGSVSVEKFSANNIIINANVINNDGAWLYYADAYSPYWQATVNGKPQRIIKANLAFKAIRLKQGESKVIFFYDNKVIRLLFYVLSSSGICFMCFVIFEIVRILIWHG